MAKYEVRVLEEVGYNEFESYCYGVYDSEEQAEAVCWQAECETGCDTYVKECE